MSEFRGLVQCPPALAVRAEADEQVAEQGGLALE